MSGYSLDIIVLYNFMYIYKKELRNCEKKVKILKCIKQLRSMATFIVMGNVKNKGNQIGCRNVESKMMESHSKCAGQARDEYVNNI